MVQKHLHETYTVSAVIGDQEIAKTYSNVANPETAAAIFAYDKEGGLNSPDGTEVIVKDAQGTERLRKNI